MFLNKNNNFQFFEPYIIAEIGSNFNQSLSLAFRLIFAAKNAGADAVKFQLFSAKRMYPNDKKMYAEILYSKEVYAKNIGLVYKEFTHETWQPPNANLVNGYYEEGSYGIKLSVIKHNF